MTVGVPPRTKDPNAPRGLHSRPRSRLRSVMGWVVFVVCVLLLAVGVRAYVLQTFYVPSPSMTPTLMPGDRIIVDKLSGTIHRGDIVVFHNVPADQDGPAILVKRVVGLPGETISSRGATVLVDGRPLPEPWLPALRGLCKEPGEHITTTHIAPRHYFVMGDCRGDSGDSRFWGTVPVGNVIGKVTAVVWRSGHPWMHWF